MSRKNIRLYLRALQNVFQSINPIISLGGLRFFRPVLLGADKKLLEGIIPTEPKKLLVKDLNSIDLKCYTYHSSKNILRNKII